VVVADLQGGSGKEYNNRGEGRRSEGGQSSEKDSNILWTEGFASFLRGEEREALLASKRGE